MNILGHVSSCNWFTGKELAMLRLAGYKSSHLGRTPTVRIRQVHKLSDVTHINIKCEDLKGRGRCFSAELWPRLSEGDSDYLYINEDLTKVIVSADAALLRASNNGGNYEQNSISR